MTIFPHGEAQAWRRFRNCILHPFRINPEAPHNRTGWQDLSHAYSNLLTETAREDSHWVGRSLAWGTPVLIFLIIVSIAYLVS